MSQANLTMTAAGKSSSSSVMHHELITIGSDSQPRHGDSDSCSESPTIGSVPVETIAVTIGSDSQPKCDESDSHRKFPTVDSMLSETVAVTIGSDSQQKHDDSDSCSELRKTDSGHTDAKLDHDQPRNECCCIALKWMLAFLILFSFLASLVLSKVSVVRLAQELYQNSSVTQYSPRSTKGVGGDEVAKEHIALILVLVSVLVPYFLGAIRSFFATLGSNDKSCWKSCAWGPILGCAWCEVSGVCMFVLIVIPGLQDQGRISLVATNSILFLPICSNAVKSVLKFFGCCRNKDNDGEQPSSNTNKEEHKKNCFLAIDIIAAVVQTIGVLLLVCIYFLEISQVSHHLETKLCLLFSMLLMSVSWIPHLQMLQIAQKQTSDHTKQQTNERTNEPNNESNQDRGLKKTSGNSADFYGAQHKASLISNILKLVFSTVTSFLIVYIRSQTSYSPGSFSLDNLRLGSFSLDNLRLTMQAMNSPANAVLIDWFALNVVSSFTGYILAIVACKMCMNESAFAFPLVMAPLITPTVSYLSSDCKGLRNFSCSLTAAYPTELYWVISATLCLWVAQTLYTVDIFRTETVVLEKERDLFWITGYNNVFLEQCMLLGRRTRKTDEHRAKSSEVRKKVRVFICTTMYHEEEQEMEQLLKSLKTVNEANLRDIKFESHIFFDDGVRGQKLNEYALQLVSLINRTLGVGFENCTKIDTPYGIRLNFRLPISQGSELYNGMEFSVHLKDSRKVKNKKRWSQVMYMSMILNYILKGETTAKDTKSFILTTDADVKFDQYSIKALLDLMLRNQRTGAVCARTYPIGSGPVVWYQMFDYAIGHWLQKVAEHELGTVLCCPGCFSMYRIEALKDILETYASSVQNEALSFLTKDMGEDRWLCTLMVQNGSQLEYSAVAVNSTYCPEKFDEFYKQRRRWILSTLANQWLLLTACPNQNIIFWFYQGFLFFSTLISPSMTILLIAGGLQYAWNLTPTASLITMGIFVIVYTVICLKTQGEVQLSVAFWFTLVFAIIMTVVTVGTVIKVVGEFAGTTCAPPTLTYPAPATSFGSDLGKVGLSSNKTQALLSATTSGPLPCEYTPVVPGTAVNFSTLYLIVLAGIYVITGLLHPTEFHYLIPGLLYVIFLPSGYLILVIYSLCNIHDVTWGTRENKSKQVIGSSKHHFENFKAKFCCCKPEDSGITPAGTINSSMSLSNEAVSSSHANSVTAPASGPSNVSEADQILQAQPAVVNHQQPSQHASDQQPNNVKHANETYLSTDEWLKTIGSNFESQYARLFNEEGYTDTSFIAGISEKKLKALKIDNNCHRKAILQASQHLEEPDYFDKIETKISAEWLKALGLGEYTQVFMTNRICNENGLQNLKNMKKKEIKKTLGIKKKGHMHRLMLGLMYLRSHPESNKRTQEARKLLQRAVACNIDEREENFWDNLRRSHLQPETHDLDHTTQLEEKLKDLRKWFLFGFALANGVWLTLMLTLEYTAVFFINGVNPMGVVFLFLFGLVLAIQFVCMIFHRLMTAIHHVGRQRFVQRSASNSSFSSLDATSLPSSNKATDDLRTTRMQRGTGDGSSDPDKQ